MYLLALLCPPLAVLMTGRIFQTILSVPFTCCFILPGMLHALLVVADHKANKRADRIADRVARKMGRGDTNVNTNVQVNVVIPSPVGPIPPIVAEAIRDHEAMTIGARKRAASERWLAEQERIQVIRSRRNEIVLAIAEAPQRTVCAAAGAYRELPEWAQSVSWGLAAGTPFAIIGAVLFLTR